MNLADHLRPLLRDHDCVIIPDFGGLVAEYAPAHIKPGGRHLLVPPSRQVAFNQALTRNDGLLVDALRQHLGLSAVEAREAVRQAVSSLHQQLRAEQRTELPGIGVFHQLPGRGLQFDYTGTDCLLPATFGLPELAAHPVRALDVRQAREQQAQLLPRLRTAGQRVGWRRVVPGAFVGLLAGVAVAGLYLLGLHPEAAPVAMRGYLPQFDAVSLRPATQQATLGQATFEQPVPTVRSSANTEPAHELLADTAAAPLASNTPAPAETAPVTTPVVAAATPSAAPVVRPAATKAPALVAASAPAAVVKPAAKPIVVAKPALVPAATHAVAGKTIKQRTGRFYVVVAAYGSLQLAENGRKNLARAGRDAKVIYPFFGTRFYRLSAADFPDKASANFAAARLRHTANFDPATSVLAY